MKSIDEPRKQDDSKTGVNGFEPNRTPMDAVASSDFISFFI